MLALALPLDLVLYGRKIHSSEWSLCVILTLCAWFSRRQPMPCPCGEDGQPKFFAVDVVLLSGFVDRLGSRLRFLSREKPCPGETLRAGLNQPAQLVTQDLLRHALGRYEEWSDPRRADVKW